MSSYHLLNDGSRPYVTALVGNGEIVTTVGPAGYHTGGPWHPALEIVVWAGRRSHDRVPGFLRMGCCRRTLTIDGKEAPLTKWEQEVVPGEGIVRSRVFHDGLREETSTFALLDRNALIFITDLISTGGGPKRVEFAMSYAMGDDEGRLPPDSVVRPRVTDGGVDIYFEMEHELGSVSIRPLGTVEATETDLGWRLDTSLELSAGERKRLGFFIGYSDRRNFYSVPASWDPDNVLSRHRDSWRRYQEASVVDLGHLELEALRRNCLYSIRCNATPWSIPPAVLPTHWEGRTFHDELYPFLALLSGGHRELASRIPRFRLKTLARAEEWSGSRGARYPWETTEEGREGASYGGWLDEHFHIGQFVETAYQWCLFGDDRETWEEYFPMFRECAEYFALNMIEERDGGPRIRSCTDYDEAFFPVENGLYTVCAAIRCLEVAAQTAGFLDRCRRRRTDWTRLAAGLRQNAPVAADGSRYLTFPGAEHHHIAELGPVFPFRIDPESDRARRTVEVFAEACRSDVGWTAGSLPNYQGSRWMWSGAHLATTWALLGEGDRAFEALVENLKATGPGLSPCEQTHPDSDEVNCPWFTTAAGAAVYAIHSLFVQTKPGKTFLFPALPGEMSDVSFSGLAVPGWDASVSARVEGGVLASLEVAAKKPGSVTLTMPTRLLHRKFDRWDGVIEAKSDGAWTETVMETSNGE